VRRAVLEHVQVKVRVELQARPRNALEAGGGVGLVAGVWGLGFRCLVLYGACLCYFVLWMFGASRCFLALASGVLGFEFRARRRLVEKLRDYLDLASGAWNLGFGVWGVPAQHIFQRVIIVPGRFPSIGDWYESFDSIGGWY
jgi:hypothetical protein